MNYNDLVEDWIVYLKDRGIVKRQSGNNGVLSYVRNPTKSDVMLFLADNGFSREKIQAAIQSSLPSSAIPVEPANGIADIPIEQPSLPEPAQDNTIETGTEVQFPGIADTVFRWGGQQWRLVNAKSGKASKIANKEVALVLTKLANGEQPATKELLDARKKLGLFASAVNSGNNISEAFVDAELSEPQISAIFTSLVSTLADSNATTAEPTEEQNIAEINAIKRSIRDTFSDKQRKALWRILSNA